MILSNGEYAVGRFIPSGATLVPAKPSGPHSWNGTQWVFDGYTVNDAFERLRFERNVKLAETDWMANSDVTMSAEWETYRQALRDITTQTPSLDSDGNLTGITWPIPPTD
jgi:hypothetical protein